LTKTITLSIYYTLSPCTRIIYSYINQGGITVLVSRVTLTLNSYSKYTFAVFDGPITTVIEHIEIISNDGRTRYTTPPRTRLAPGDIDTNRDDPTLMTGQGIYSIKRLGNLNYLGESQVEIVQTEATSITEWNIFAICCLIGIAIICIAFGTYLFAGKLLREKDSEDLGLNDGRGEYFDRNPLANEDDELVLRKRSIRRVVID